MFLVVAAVSCSRVDRADHGSAAPSTESSSLKLQADGGSQSGATNPLPPPKNESQTNIDKGLAHLIALQLPEGGWKNDVGMKIGEGYVPEQRGISHVGVSALCLMALMANGHTPQSGAYKPNVEKGLEYICSLAGRSGYINANSTRMRSHALATQCLAIAASCGGSKKCREVLTKAVNYIVEVQVKDQENIPGGWRYEPRQHDADILNVTHQILALDQAIQVGAKVPPETMELAGKYIAKCYSATEQVFTYQCVFRYDRSSFCTNAAGTLAYLLTRTDGTTNVDLAAMVNVLTTQRPDRVEGFEANKCNFGYWIGQYFASCALKRYLAEDTVAWDTWRKVNHSRLPLLQQPNGAWIDEIGSFDPKTNAYATAMACLVLSQ